MEGQNRKIRTEISDHENEYFEDHVLSKKPSQVSLTEKRLWDKDAERIPITIKKEPLQRSYSDSDEEKEISRKGAKNEKKSQKEIEE